MQNWRGDRRGLVIQGASPNINYGRAFFVLGPRAFASYFRADHLKKAAQVFHQKPSNTHRLTV